MATSLGDIAGRLRIADLTLFLILACAGCQQSEELALLPGRVLAEGEVLLDGSPLDSGMITLIPEKTPIPEDQDEWCLGTISNGRFKVQIQPGRYIVRIQKYDYADPKKSTPMLPERYDQKSTLSAEILEDGSQQLAFQLESQPER